VSGRERHRPPILACSPPEPRQTLRALSRNTIEHTPGTPRQNLRKSPWRCKCSKWLQLARIGQPSADLERWDLHDYIEVAAELAVINPDTATQSRLAKDYRNLIHPGRTLRLGQKCDRATALSAVAGVEYVVRDLTPP
jgi:hypothetical protein